MRASPSSCRSLRNWHDALQPLDHTLPFPIAQDPDRQELVDAMIVMTIPLSMLRPVTSREGAVLLSDEAFVGHEGYIALNMIRSIIVLYDQES